MITYVQIKKNSEIHGEGCKASVSSDGKVYNNISLYHQTSKLYRWKRLDKFQVSVKRSSSNKALHLTQDTAHKYHAPEDCPLNPAVYFLNGHRAVLCDGHKKVREHAMKTLLEKGEFSKEKCFDCLILEKEQSEEELTLDLLATKVLFDSMIKKDQSSVRWGAWNRVNDVWEFQTPEKVEWRDGPMLSFSNYGEQRMIIECLIAVERNSKNSRWLNFIETAVNYYLKDHPLDGGDECSESES